MARGGEIGFACDSATTSVLALSVEEAWRRYVECSVTPDRYSSREKEVYATNIKRVVISKTRE
jgi:hypothetical protein